ncbi:MAG: hypothetical protein V1799_10070 [bacterium]
MLADVLRASAQKMPACCLPVGRQGGQAGEPAIILTITLSSYMKFYPDEIVSI